MRKTKLLIGLFATAMAAFAVAGLKDVNMKSASASGETFTFIDFSWTETASKFTTTDSYEYELDGVVVNLKASMNSNDTAYFESPSQPVSLGSSADECYIEITHLPSKVDKIEFDMIASRSDNGITVTIDELEPKTKSANKAKTLEHVSFDVGETVSTITFTNCGTERRVSVSNIKITYEKEIRTADDYAEYFLDKTDDICNNGSYDNFDELNEIWDNLAEKYDLLLPEVKEDLVDETANETIKDFVSRYSYIVSKYNTDSVTNLEEFVEGLTITHNSQSFGSVISNNSLLYVVLGSTAAVSLLFVALLLKKNRKENN